MQDDITPTVQSELPVCPCDFMFAVPGLFVNMKWMWILFPLILPDQCGLPLNSSLQTEFLYLCAAGWASSIHACVCLCSAINEECDVLLGVAADVELWLFTCTQWRESRDLLHIFISVMRLSGRWNIQSPCEAAVNRKTVEVSQFAG